MGNPSVEPPTKNLRRWQRGNVSLLAESALLPELPEGARALLQQIAPQQFFLPDGRRATGHWEKQRKGVLDLYSGKAGLAKELAKLHVCWVLIFDYVHGEDQTAPIVQKLILSPILESSRRRSFLVDGGCSRVC